MEKKLFVSGLPYSTTGDELRDHFAAAGAVESAVVISDKMTGRSKGFGFVEFSTPEEAQNAISMFNETDLGGRSIRVSIARPMEDRPRRTSGGGGGFGGGNNGGGNRRFGGEHNSY